MRYCEFEIYDNELSIEDEVGENVHIGELEDAYALLNVLAEFIKLKEGVNDECSTKE